MAAREVLRRVLLWGITAVFLATCAVFAFAAVWSGSAGIEAWWGLLGFTAFPIVGAIILTAHPGNGVGWYLLAVAILCLALMWGLDAQLVETAPGWVESLLNATAGVFWTSLPVIGVIYPSGRPETRLGRGVLWAVVAVAVTTFVVTLIGNVPLTSGRSNPFAVPSASWLLEPLDGAVFIVFALIAGIIIVDLMRRWRAADPITSLQYRWFVFGLSIVIFSVSITSVCSLFLFGTPLFDVMGVIATLSFNLLPISIGIAVTRHGLYEIDRIVSRTVAYATVTALAIGVYTLVVTSTTWLAPQLPSVGVAIATLAGAAVFLPALRWVQRVIDRHFDRERYDAQRIVDDFGERLRTGIEPSTTASDLTAAVREALQPTSLGVWTAGRQ